MGKRGAKQRDNQMAQWSFWTMMKNIGLHIMQTMSFVSGRGLGQLEDGTQYPVEVWRCSGHCGVMKQSGVERLLEPPHDCQPIGSGLGDKTTWLEWVSLLNVWKKSSEPER